MRTPLGARCPQDMRGEAEIVRKICVPDQECGGMSASYARENAGPRVRSRSLVVAVSARYACPAVINRGSDQRMSAKYACARDGREPGYYAENRTHGA